MPDSENKIFNQLTSKLSDLEKCCESLADNVNIACSMLKDDFPDSGSNQTEESSNQTASNTCFNVIMMQKLAEQALKLIDSDFPAQALIAVLDDAISLSFADKGQILIWGDNENHFDRIVPVAQEREITITEKKLADALSEKVYHSNNAILITDTGLHPDLSEKTNENGLGFLSIIVAPISLETDHKVERIGAMYLSREKGDNSFSETDFWLVRFLCSLTALSIRNIRLTASLRMAYQDTVTALVKALEAKDPYTRGHSERVAEYSERLGKRFGFNESQLRILTSAAILHDIGKIGIRESVLNKPSKLTPEEYQHIKKHPEISQAIIHGLTFLSEENKILAEHHERYDGNGYPKGLKGEEILLEGAIIQVADAWDAMTSRRVYRRELDVDIALNEIESNSGTQFNPVVVKEFVKMIIQDGIIPIYDLV